MRRQKGLLWVFALFTAAMLTGCGSDSDIVSDAPPATAPPDTDTVTTTPLEKTITDLDATAGGLGAPADDPRNKYTYVDLSTGNVVALTDAEAGTSSAWDIAFKRSVIKLNGGISGPKGVVGYSVGNNPEAYDAAGEAIRSWFETATAEAELPDFTSVTSSAIPTDDADFMADEHVSAILGDGTDAGWWFYAGPPTHAVTAVETNWWVVRSAAGDSYIKFHVTDILRDTPAGYRTIRLEWVYQGPTDVAFGAVPQLHDIVVPLDGGGKYLDFDSTPTDGDDPVAIPGWDMKVEYDGAAQSYKISLNGGVSGTGEAGSFGPTETPDDFVSETDVPHFSADAAGGLFNDAPWNAYNVTGVDHKLWPNYRVYLIKSEEKTYKIQFLSYYHSATAESGWYTFRFQQIAP